jgi:histone H2A
MNRDCTNFSKTIPTSQDFLFPASRVQRYLKKAKIAERVSKKAGVYLAAVLEYLTCEMLEMSGQAAIDFRKKRISPNFIQMAIKNDPEMDKVLSDVHICNSGVGSSVKIVQDDEIKEVKNDPEDSEDENCDI